MTGRMTTGRKTQALPIEQTVPLQHECCIKGFKFIDNDVYYLVEGIDGSRCWVNDDVDAPIKREDIAAFFKQMGLMVSQFNKIYSH
jgi:hypothetical protein